MRGSSNFGAIGGEVGAEVGLTLPADAQLIRIARLVASGLASIGGFDVDDIDDVRIGVDELCAGVMDAAEDGHVRLDLALGGGLLEVAASAPGTGALPPAANPLADPILDAVADDHTWTAVDGRVVGRLAKRRRPAAG